MHTVGVEKNTKRGRKWEGYAEYISRQSPDQKDLKKNLDRFVASEKNRWEIEFSDSTIAPSVYYASWTMVQYCMDVKNMTYQQLLSDTTNEQTVEQEMMRWFHQQKK